VIEELDKSLEKWLRARVNLGNRGAEVSFAKPESEWSQRRATPLVNLYLYSLAPSETRNAASLRTVRTADGGYARQRDAPIMTARFLITVWSSDPAVEHDLLAQVAHLLTTSRGIPSEFMTPTIAALRPPPVLSTEPDPDITVAGLWQALDVPARLGTYLSVEMAVGVPEPTVTNDPPEILQFGFVNRRAPAARSARRRIYGRSDSGLAGGRAVGRRGSAIVQDSGRYLIDAQPGDEIVVEPPDGEPDDG
jgi:hypothetical protein